jgi:hypothetical protein
MQIPFIAFLFLRALTTMLNKAAYTGAIGFIRWRV